MAGHDLPDFELQNACEESDVANACEGVLKALPKPSLRRAEVHRDIVGTALLTVNLMPWHMLPVFTDIKIADDPLLPGLTSQTLPLTATAIFCGWLSGSLGLKKVMETFSEEQLIVGGSVGLLLVTVSMITLPYLTDGNLAVFSAVRFLYGVLMNIKPVQVMYVQDRVPAAQFNHALVVQYCLYAFTGVLMAFSCGYLTFFSSWTLEVALWCGLGRCLPLWIAFPNAWEILRTIPETMKQAKRGNLARRRCASEMAGFDGASNLTATSRGHAGRLIICFMACGCGYYGLSYSAGQLSSNVYLSSMALCTADIVGYLMVNSADFFRRKSVQLCGFLTSVVCLALCSIGEPGSNFMLLFAVVGRLGIDVCFTTIMLILAESFLDYERVVVLPLCETAARLASIIAPFVGTLPASLSCPLFSAICLAAACATINLPDGLSDGQSLS